MKYSGAEYKQRHGANTSSHSKERSAPTSSERYKHQVKGVATPDPPKNGMGQIYPLMNYSNNAALKVSKSYHRKSLSTAAHPKLNDLIHQIGPGPILSGGGKGLTYKPSDPTRVIYEGYQEPSTLEDMMPGRESNMSSEHLYLQNTDQHKIPNTQQQTKTGYKTNSNYTSMQKRTNSDHIFVSAKKETKKGAGVLRDNYIASIPKGVGAHKHQSPMIMHKASYKGMNALSHQEDPINALLNSQHAKNTSPAHSHPHSMYASNNPKATNSNVIIMGGKKFRIMTTGQSPREVVKVQGTNEVKYSTTKKNLSKSEVREYMMKSGSKEKVGGRDISPNIYQKGMAKGLPYVEAYKGMGIGQQRTNHTGSVARPNSSVSRHKRSVSDTAGLGFHGGNGGKGIGIPEKGMPMHAPPPSKYFQSPENTHKTTPGKAIGVPFTTGTVNNKEQNNEFVNMMKKIGVPGGKGGFMVPRDYVIPKKDMLGVPSTATSSQRSSSNTRGISRKNQMSESLGHEDVEDIGHGHHQGGARYAMRVKTQGGNPIPQQHKKNIHSHSLYTYERKAATASSSVSKFKQSSHNTKENSIEIIGRSPNRSAENSILDSREDQEGNKVNGSSKSSGQVSIDFLAKEHINVLAKQPLKNLDNERKPRDAIIRKATPKLNKNRQKMAVTPLEGKLGYNKSSAISVPGSKLVSSNHSPEPSIHLKQLQGHYYENVSSNVNNKYLNNANNRNITDNSHKSTATSTVPTALGFSEKRKKEVDFLVDHLKTHLKTYGEVPKTTTEFYKVGKMLGKGAFGKVNLGVHKLTGKFVAIKSLNKELLTDEHSKKKVMKEVSILQQLRHQSVIRLYETFESKKHILFVIELCTGGDLLTYVRKRRKLKEKIAKNIFKQILEGLYHCHNKNILHRDIKLDNILLNSEGRIKICDFGVSKIVRRGERMYEQCGTPAYIAPEILKDRGYEGYAVDMWSAGVVLYAILYGTVPFKANNMSDLHKLILKGKFTLKEDVSEEARDLLTKLLEPEPKERFTIGQILCHPWYGSYEDKYFELFNENEKEAMMKEFTYGKRYRNAGEDLVNGGRMNTTQGGTHGDMETELFTEHTLDTTQNSLTKNVSDKSVILAPFNSTHTHNSELHDSVRTLLKEKRRAIKFGPKVREIDRQYEKNNNSQLDNGVYNKFMVDTQKDKTQENLDPLASNSGQGSMRDEESDEEPGVPHASSPKRSMSPIGRSKLSTKMNTKSALSLLTLHTTRPLAIDDEVLLAVESFGFPRDYIVDSLRNNKQNHASATYFLLSNQ